MSQCKMPLCFLGFLTLQMVAACECCFLFDNESPEITNPVGIFLTFIFFYTMASCIKWISVIWKKPCQSILFFLKYP